MTLQALIFDVDGTLADTEEAHRCAFNRAFEEAGLDWHWDRPLYAKLLRTTGGKERMAAYLASLALPETERHALAACIAELHRAKTAHYARSVESGQIVLREGVARLIEDARHAGIRLAIATTTSYANVEALLCTALGTKALELFAAIGAGDQVKHKKPAPDVYLWVLEHLELPPHACVAFEDSANGLRSAKAADLFTIVTPSFWTSAEDFSAADLVLPSLGTVFGIDDIARHLDVVKECG